MKSKSYFVDRIIKLRGGGDKDELMKLQMVDLLQILNDERTKHHTVTDNIEDMMIPKEEEQSDSEDESIVSLVKRFLFTPPKGE
jgi:hypothetical protein